MKFILLLMVISFWPVQLRAQFLGCNFQEVDLLPCLIKTGENASVDCCLALGKALTAGHNCFCSVLFLTNTQLSSAKALLTASPLALEFPGCSLISPSLADCEMPFMQNSPPVVTKEPNQISTTASAPSTSTQNTSEEHQDMSLKTYNVNSALRLEKYESFATIVLCCVISISALIIV